ncbi:epoxyqueuosine reductase [Ligilactobacillus salitolerans]|uniref:Epoxyqueuosine reductase n=1 Tax=Ligilactobacillus salitolerans TaxID=1808352 RepID=A0A401IRP7_9LACO|nr:tRNA epoxyqueuosine(34) reductase QueG [Ligilactobacillus salitolerans]GBG94201.1 epoxyqueuosine reductase [Ligilactobacillus salitolerans]
MANAALKEQIIAASQKIGIDKIGFTTADDFEHLRPSLVAQKAAGHTSGFEHQNLDERLDPALIFDQPRSIIAIALAYPTKLQQRPPKTKYKRGHFARASWGNDYHDILRQKMADLIEQIKVLAGEQVTFKPMVDTGELIDVAVAQRAGLGFIGKNGLLITEEFGSFVYLGEIITNIEFEPDQPQESQCGDCTRCIDYCPPGALLGDGRLDAQKCLSYQTQTKGLMDEQYRPLIRNVIYGCDICQMVCPFNRGKNFHFHPEMEPDPDKVSPELVPLLTISNKQFKAEFGPMAGSWRGKKPLQRNALIALANLGDRSAIPEILQVVEQDPRPVIRATGAYALGRLVRDYNPEISGFLQQKLQQEEDAGLADEYLREYRAAIRKINALQ